MVGGEKRVDAHLAFDFVSRVKFELVDEIRESFSKRKLEKCK